MTRHRNLAGRKLRPALMAFSTALWGTTAIAQSVAPVGPAFQIAGEERTAIVIGNQDYHRVSDLANGRRDAEAMADMLRRFGFTVYAGYDLDRRGFEALIRSVMLNIPDGADVVFYYTGHGLQIGPRNYLLPVDATFDEIYDLPAEAMTLDRVMDALSARGATNVTIIDSSRENPFPDRQLATNLAADVAETKAGFDVQRAPLNSLIAFNASPGQVGYDGPDGGNSPYTEAVLQTVAAEPEEDLSSLFGKVRQLVYDATGGKQVTWESSTLVQPFRMQNPAFMVLDVFEDTQLAQADTGETDSQTPQQPALTLDPDIAELTLTLDRTVLLTEALAQNLGGAVERPKLITPPESGQVVFDTEGAGIGYRPEFSEIRATDLRTASVEASFRVEVGPATARQPIDVTLRLVVDPCDLAAGDALDLDGVGYFRLANEINVAQALAACAAAIEARPDTPRFHYQLGRAQRANREFDAAFASFERASDSGHTRAKNALGVQLQSEVLNRDLVDIPFDPARANAYFEQGVAAGDPYAMHSLGKNLLRNGETSAKRQRGFELLERAVELGHTFSMNELGFYFLNKNAEHYQPERGMIYLNASSAREDIFGHNNLGLVALRGLDGKDPDLERARIMFVRAADGGHPFAPGNLGRMANAGQIPGEGPAEAVAYYDEGLKRGDGWGGANAAWLILNGKVSGLGAPDAAIRAAKATHLSSADAAEEARGLLGRIGKRDLGRALQTLLNDLGEDVAVDGAVGPGTRAALDRVLSRHGLTVEQATPVGQLRAAAKAYWAEQPSRPDLF